MQKSSPYKPLPDSEQITDPTKVSRLLERFTKHYTPLTVQIPGDKEHYTSSIVGVDKKYVAFIFVIGFLLSQSPIPSVNVKFT